MWNNGDMEDALVYVIPTETGELYFYTFDLEEAREKAGNYPIESFDTAQEAKAEFPRLRNDRDFAEGVEEARSR